MKILISVQYFDPAKGGAEKSLQTITKELAKEHEVIVIQAGKKEKIEILNNFNIITKKVSIYDEHWIFPIIPQCEEWRLIIDNEIQKYNPDLIITQLNFAAPTIDIANKYNIPSIMFIRSYEHFCPDAFLKGVNCDKNCKNCMSFRFKTRYPNIEKWLEWNKKAIINSNLVIANSYFVANITEKWTGIIPEILYPTINLKNYKTLNQKREYITMIKPSKEKGIEIFLKIVKNTPNEKFLIVGGNRILKVKKQLYKLNNLKIINWTNDMGSVYNKTKILLTPSMWEEPFGRVIIEAGINNIPIIASYRGGLPEAVGDGGIVINDIYNISLWKRAINLLNNDQNYNDYANKAKINAMKFDFNENFKIFKNMINEKLMVI